MPTMALGQRLLIAAWLAGYVAAQQPLYNQCGGIGWSGNYDYLAESYEILS